MSLVRRSKPLLAKSFAASAKNAPIHHSTSDVDPLTVLHRAASLFPRVPRGEESSNSRRVPDSEVWKQILSNVYEDLSALTDRPVKIAVIGVDEWSGSQDLVTALLADPLSSNEEHITQLRNRWSDPSLQKINILRESEEDARSPLKSRFSFLAQFPVAIELAEFRPRTVISPITSSSLFQILQNEAMNGADIPIIVCNPLTVSLETLICAQLPVNTILVVTSTTARANFDAVIKKCLRTLPSSHRLHKGYPDIIAVDPGRAVNAITTIQGQHTSPSAVQKFQDDFVESNVSEVAHALRRRLTSKRTFTLVRKNMAISHLRDALQWSSVNVLQLRNELDRIFIDVSALMERIKEIQAKVETQFFASDGSERNVVNEAIQEAEVKLKDVMDSLPWWRMIWRVDEISTIVGAAIKGAWCHNLEKKLILSTGNIAAIQADISESAFALLSRHRISNTAVLRNTLLQIKSSLNYRLTPNTLTQPILIRRNQLIEYPTIRLHIAAQRATLSTIGGSISGMGLGWAGWMGWLLDTGYNSLGLTLLEPGTAIGIGALITVASVKWAISSWEKAKKQWWEDWRRLGDGLERDLKTTLGRTMDQQVVTIGLMTCENLTQLIRAQEVELAEVSRELSEVQSELDAVFDPSHDV